jgi:hypothetical protein
VVLEAFQDDICSNFVQRQTNAMQKEYKELWNNAKHKVQANTIQEGYATNQL